jgi:hypothetical protein
MSFGGSICLLAEILSLVFCSTFVADLALPGKIDLPLLRFVHTAINWRICAKCFPINQPGGGVPPDTPFCRQLFPAGSASLPERSFRLSG